MVSSFSTVLKDKISAIIEENEQMLLAAGRRKLVSYKRNMQQNHRNTLNKSSKCLPINSVNQNAKQSSY